MAGQEVGIDFTYLGALIEHFLEGSARLREGYGTLTQKRRFEFVNVTLWKCSIKAPAI